MKLVDIMFRGLSLIGSIRLYIKIDISFIAKGKFEETEMIIDEF